MRHLKSQLTLFGGSRVWQEEGEHGSPCSAPSRLARPALGHWCNALRLRSDTSEIYSKEEDTLCDVSFPSCLLVTMNGLSMTGGEPDTESEDRQCCSTLPFSSL
ncbi:hypothetical protein E2C01_029663 [Portunus trituberculatus]|uniref:Uncharacterized protein n=1 Tax=Portunus trituberculatus TaxID=210409 RepID=A0A5B7EV60_PORTR|nr:hypothetical protein [Portunus trituberculatus]